MRLLWTVTPLFALIGALQDFGACPPLESPTGTHPETGTILSAGEYDVISSDGEILAKPLCYAQQGWFLTSTHLQELKCTYDEIRDKWSWDHRRNKRSASPNVRCSYLSAKPIVQRFTLQNYGACSDPTERDVFVRTFKSKLNSVLPCVLEGWCVVDYVTCLMKPDSPEHASLAIKIRSIALASLGNQMSLMDAAVDFLLKLDATFFDDDVDRVEESAGRGRRQAFDPDSADSGSTNTSGCDSGHIEDSVTGGCLSCVAGTYANTTNPSNQTCSPCPLDEYSEENEAVQCTQCSGTGIGTLDIGTYSADDCVVVCVVPEIENAVSTEPEAGHRVENSDIVIVHCDSDHAYQGETTAVVTCFVDDENNGFHDSCELMCEEGLVEVEGECAADDEDEGCGWEFAYGDCEQREHGCYRDTTKYCECSNGTSCDDAVTEYEEECYSCWDEYDSGSSDHTTSSLVILLAAHAWVVSG